jgi:pre-mRNA-splicing factor CWC22
LSAHIQSADVFKFDPEFEQREEEYEKFKKEILGDDEDSESEAGGAASGSESDEDEDKAADGIGETVDIHDFTGTNLVNFRRRVYLTIMSSADFEEAVHKLLKMPMPEGQEVRPAMRLGAIGLTEHEQIEMCNMIIECCSQERSYSKFYGLIGERLCKLREVWSVSFDQAFRTYFDTIHRYETNRLRNIGRFFGHLIATDAISWTIFDVVSMNEDDTTSSSRIFIKILMQELVEFLGLPGVKARFLEPSLQSSFRRMFPLDNPKNTRFAIKCVRGRLSSQSRVY